MRNYQHSLKNLRQNVNLFDFVDLSNFIIMFGSNMEFHFYIGLYLLPE